MRRFFNRYPTRFLITLLAGNYWIELYFSGREKLKIYGEDVTTIWTTSFQVRQGAADGCRQETIEICEGIHQPVIGHSAEDTGEHDRDRTQPI